MKITPEELADAHRLIPLADLRPLEGNAHRGDRAAIRKSLDEFGQFESIAVWRGEVLIGNHRVDEAKELGWENLSGYDLSEFDLDVAGRIARALASNRIAQLGSEDEEMLSKLLSSVDEPRLVTAAGFDDNFLANLLAAGDQGGGEDTNLPEPPSDPITRSGDVWLLRDHRVICGDSTDPEVLAKVLDGRLVDALVTDPPYGVDYGNTVEFRRSMGKTQRQTDNSHVRADGLVDAIDLWARVFPLIRDVMSKRSAFYCWSPGGDQQCDLMLALRSAGFDIHGVAIWVKSSFSFSRSDHKYQHEPVLYGWLADGVHDWHGPNNESSVWEWPRPSSSPEHPTMKPVELIKRCIRNISEPGDLVFDPFLGSGTTIIAAEDVGQRKAVGIEFEPKYVDVICTRFQRLTGVVPVLAATGCPQDFLGT